MPEQEPRRRERLRVGELARESQQIDDRLSAFESDNTLLITAAAAVHTARQAEDIAFKRFSGKDFASDDLKREDRLEDQYMSTIRADKPCTVYVVDGADLNEHYRQSPTAERMGRDYMAYRLEQVKSRIIARYQQKGGIGVTDI